ncbi:hypothetical protein DMUE_4777 [Dictyocoela muelleri]|nr:hypothetical protein DMUE_4777 [Dictyocoela muelleri]
MSEFFNFQEETEKKKISKFIAEESSDDEIKMTNKDKKLEELRKQVLEMKPSELESFVKNIKKYKNLFKQGLPSFLLKFFEENMKNRDKCNKALATKIKRVIEQYKVVDEGEVKVIEKTERKVDFHEKLNQLMKGKGVISNLDKLYSESGCLEKIRIDFVKIGIFNQEIIQKKFKNYDLYANLIRDISKLINGPEDPSEGELKSLNENFKKNLSFFLEKLMSILDVENFSDFDSLLEELNNSGYETGREKLEFYYFYKNELLETEDKEYKILFFVRNGDYDFAKRHYSEKDLSNCDIDERILYEMGVLAYKSSDLIFAFDIFERIKNKDTTLFKLSLCAILGPVLKSRNFFQKVFLQKIKTFENKYLLPSVYVENEIIRLFFLIRRQRIRESSEILVKHLNIDIYPYLKNNVLDKLIIK